MITGFTHSAGSELEKVMLCYNAINPAPIWAVAENYRFEPAFVEGRKLMAEIGDVINIHVIIEGSMNSSNPYYSSSWRRDFSGGFILDMGVHFISGLRMLAGCEITSVSAITSHVDSTLPPPDHISSTIQQENGSSGVFVMVVSSRSPKVLWRIVGLKVTLQVERGSKDGKHGHTKKSDLLLNVDDLDAMWFCLRENCVIDDATGAEKCCIFLEFSFSMTFMTWPTYPILKRVNQQPSVA
ncbi:probable serine/threonine-protein phosphatase 2a regulatory subunit b'' subunit ton2 [Phtheirospermum japonicum]|uniref:Probable serine/threonine-protein phosphatase 2a regulatory subunit b'' subunit ton2 n=1 Tax=Phtheirospermum japonicum TaxID=374723 RepID=A0A830DFZ8_9LAMI|nr:probable serine/threonine-protein phosphatase 2a regulatory subunit b'' subunit ton2 [Phtheirospermum japonicum]